MKKAQRKSFKQWLLEAAAGSRMRFELLKFNLAPLLVVEAIYTAVTSAIMVPLFSLALQAIVSISGLDNFTIENAGAFFCNPLTIICTLALLLCLGFYSLLDIGAAIYTFDAARQRIRVSISSIALFSLKNAARMFRPKNLAIVLVCLVLVPFMGLGMTSSLLSSLPIPSVFSTAIKSSLGISVAFLIIIVLCFVLSLRWMYAIHFFTIEGIGFIPAVRKSARLKRSQRIQNLLSMVVIQIVLGALTKLVSTVGLAVVTFVLGTVGAESILGALLASFVAVAFMVLALALSLLSMPIGALKISGKLYYNEEASEREIKNITCKPYTPSKQVKRRWGILVGVIWVAAILVLAIYGNLTATSQNNNPLINKTSTQAFAYQNGSMFEHKNTLSTLAQAAAAGADGAVVDVQVSKDNVAFLASSADASVVCGLFGSVRDFDFEEIHADTLKSYKDEQKSAARLADAVAYAREANLQLVVNISALADADATLTTVIETLQASNALGSVSIASNSYEELERVHELAPEAGLVFVAGISDSDFAGYENIQAVGLESFIITSANVQAAHELGIKVYAWDVYDANSMDSAIQAGVDGVVSSQVKTVVEEIGRAGLSQLEYAFFSGLS